jgi:hypothetical protein
MKITRVRRTVLCVVSVLVAAAVSAPCLAQDLVVARVESLDSLMADVEAIGTAIGQPVSKDMLLGMAGGFFGADPSGFLAMDRPVAAVLPVEGMMVPKTGVVVAVPVTNIEAALDALGTRFPNHTVNGEVHTFSAGEGPSLYLTTGDGYVRVGGMADLVKRIDPLANGPTGSTTSVEMFLEPVAPMIIASLGTIKAQMMSGMERAAEAESEMPYDPAAMEPIFDAYLDSFRWLVNNTSSVRLRMDVDDDHFRFAKDLVPRSDSQLLAFIESQKGGLPKIAKLTDSSAAWYMAGQVSLTDEHRQGLTAFANNYVDVMTSIAVSQPPSDDPDADSAAADPMAFWNEYMAMFGPYVGRWMECLRGDVVASFDAVEGEPFGFTEAFGLVDNDSCSTLVSEMGDDFVKAMQADSELANVVEAGKGPKIGGAESLVVKFDLVQMVEEMGQPTDEDTEAVLKNLYGEEMSVAMVTAGDIVFAAGGANAVDRLGQLTMKLKAPGKAPSFSPLKNRPGFMMGFNLEAMLNWIKSSVPEDSAEIESAAKRLSGDKGRIPMALVFDSHMATWDMAVSLDTIEVIAEIAAEQRAKRAEEQTMSEDEEY